MTGLRRILSLLTAMVSLTSDTILTAAPQNDADGLLFLVNRQWTVSELYEPEVTEAHVKGQVRNMRADAAAALEEMFAACKADIKVTLVSVSGYRSYGKQKNIYARKLRSVNNSVGRADAYVARPGASEHQLGLAMDIGQMNNKSGLKSSFGNTKGGKWIREHCWEYGFILRYQEGWEDVTGYSAEPWHVRYVGKEYAKQIHEANVPLETWLADFRTQRLLDLLEGDIQ